MYVFMCTYMFTFMLNAVFVCGVDVDCFCGFLFLNFLFSNSLASS